MKMKKLISIGLILACTVAMTACGSKKEETDSKGEDKKTLVMATNAEFPPYEYYEGDKIVGIDAEFAAAIAEKLGMELKIEDMAFNSVISAVQSGKADIGVAGLTVDETRKKSVDFTDTYYTGRQVIIVTEDSSIASVDDLTDKKIGVQEGTTGDLFTTEEYGDEFIERFNKGMEAVMSLSQGKVDAVVIDDQPAETFVEQNEGLKILDTEYAEEDYAMAVKKGNDDLLKKVNDAIKALKDDGTFDEIVAKYIK